MNKPFVNYSGNYRQLYSGNPDDAVPFLSIGPGENNVIIFQIPGGTGLQVPLSVALEFAVGIIDVTSECLKDESRPNISPP